MRERGSRCFIASDEEQSRDWFEAYYVAERVVVRTGRKKSWMEKAIENC